MKSRWVQFILIGWIAAVLVLMFLFGLKLGLGIGLLPSVGVVWAINMFQKTDTVKISHNYRKERRLRRARRRRYSADTEPHDIKKPDD